MSHSAKKEWTICGKTAFESTQPVIVSDDTDDADGRSALVFPAIIATDSLVNRCIILSHGASAYVGLGPHRAENFQLEPMGFNRSVYPAENGTTPRELVSIEARQGVTTGISASDRATTIRILGEAEPKPRDLVKPGHVFPLRVREGGVLVRSAIPEASVDIATSCGFSDAACFFELFSKTGEYLSHNETIALSEREQIPRISISEIIIFRLQHEQLVSRVSEVKLPTHYGSDMRAILYSSQIHKGDHLAIIKGTISSEQPVLTRVHPENTFQDVFGPSTKSSGTALQRALHAIGQSEVGVIVYLRRPDEQPLSQELQLTHETSGYAAVRSKGALMKEYGLGAQILRDLGVRKIDLLSKSTTPAAGLATYGLRVVNQRPLPEESLS